MNKIKAAIIEDEIPAARLLRDTLLSLRPDWEVQLLPGNIEEAVEWFGQHPHPDILFLDIQLTDGNSFLFIEQAHPESMIVFTTAYDEYALEAFRVSSIDYLLKPVTLSSLEHALNKFFLFNPAEREEHIQRTNSVIKNRGEVRKLLIMLADKFYPLSIDDIYYFYTAREKVTAYTFDGKKHPVDRTLDTLGEQLDQRFFFRANRQFIISRKSIRDVNLWLGNRLSVNLLLPVPERIIISKVKTPIFKKWLMQEDY